MATTLPTDPLFASQWHLSNTGQRGAPGIDINLVPVWGRYTGKGVVVAVNDDGMDLEHPDLLPNYLLDRVYDGVRDVTGQGFGPGAERAHGTVVGSLIGMVAGNGIGGVGVAYESKIVPNLTPNGDGGNDKLFLANLAAGAGISVNSWGSDPAFAENFGASGSATDRAWGQALTRVATEARGGLGMVIEVSGGNERGNRADNTLSNFNGNKLVISVASVTHEGTVTSYSTPGLALLVTAPGGTNDSEANQSQNSGYGIVSADVSGAAGYNTTTGDAGNYAYQNTGTSYSGPIVAGIAALMLEANPQLGFRDVSMILALTARKNDANGTSWVQQSGGDWNLGGMHYSRDHGYGLVDGAAAVRLAASWAGGQNTVANWNSVAGTSATAAGNVADGSSEPFTATAAVASNLIIERLELDLDIGMLLPSQLSASLTSPAGTTHLLFDRPLTRALDAQKNPTGPETAWPGLFTLGIAAFMGENAQGTWTLQLRDAVTGEVAQFRSMAVRAWGIAPSPQNQYVFTNEFSGSKTLTDAAGIDTVNAAAVSTAVNLSLAPLGNSTLGSGSFTLAAGTVIENATGGAGNDTLLGNDETNTLRGNDGNDTLSGGAGNDSLAGGLGDDRLEGGAGDDAAVFAGPRASYTITTIEGGVSVSSTAEGTDTLLDVERLAFSDQTILATSASNNAPVAADGTATTAEDTPLTGTLPAATDPDGDVPTYAVQAQPTLGTVTVNANGGYSYTPNPNANGTDTFTFSVSDGKGGSRSYRQTVNVSAVNDAPVVAAPMPDRTATVGTPFSYTVPAGTFTDVDSSTLSLSAALESGAALPAWLSFDGATRTFSGTPSAAQIGAINVRVSASDGAAAATDVIRLGVVGAPNPLLPSDPLVASQWHLSNTGQRGAPGIDINLAPVWGRYTGRGVIVAVNDDGMDLAHPDLLANLLLDLTYDATRDTTGQGFAESAKREHGTVVGSLVGMVAGNGIGGVGVAYEAKIIPGLTGGGATNAKLFLANLAANASVSVNSWGNDAAFGENFGASGAPEDRSWGEALTRAATEGRGGLGMIIEVSGGNERGNRADNTLSNFNGNKITISVGSVTNEGIVTDYSTPGLTLLVTAPGGNSRNVPQSRDEGYGIVAADVSGIAGYNKTEGEAGNYSYQNVGTSYSGPIVAGIAALMLHANPQLGLRDVSSILALTARKTDPGNSSWVQQSGSDWNLGGMHYSRDYGYGLVDGAAAVRLAASWAGGQNTMANWTSVVGTSATAAGTIADGSGENFVATANVASSLVIERLELDVEVTMLKPSQLAATIISPAGTSLLLFDRPLTQGLNAQTNEPEGPENAWPGVFTIGIASFMGESAQGTWTLQLRDVVSGEAAEFKSFTVRAWGHAPGPQNQYVFTDEFTGTKTLTDSGGVDTVNAAAVSTAVTLSLAEGAGGTLSGGSFTLAAGTQIENATGGAGNDSLTGNAQANTLRGNEGNDTIHGGDGFDVIAGGLGSDQLDGGDGIVDIADYRGASAVTLSLLAGTATQGGDTDTLAGFEAIFGSSAADTLRGRDGAETQRSDTIRGGAGNDTIDGGAGVDIAEYSGARGGYTVTRTESGFTVQDSNPSNGDDGSDTLANVERLMFGDRMLAFGTRAEELARVAFVLWTPGILVSSLLFARGYSFYDNGGYDFATMCGAALTFHGEQGEAYAQKLIANMPGQSRTAADVLAIMTNAGGGEAGRVAALIAVANDAATTAAIEASGIRTNGVTADLFVPGFGNLFGLLPG